MAYVNLYDALKSSYGDKKSSNELANAGYKYDSMLSNRNQQVWYNPKTSHLLYNIAGTHNFQDIGTDAYLVFGKLKDTNRYKEARTTLENAKLKYGMVNPISTTIAGHSLGGAIGQYVAGKDDMVYTLDKGTTIGQKTRSNEYAFRTSGDAVSLLSSGATRVTTLPNHSYVFSDPLTSHNVSNIKKANIKI